MTADEHLARGRALWEAGNLEEAEAEFTRAIELDPSHAEALAYRGGVRLAKGQADLVRALEIRPDLPEAHLELALLGEQQGRPVDERLAHLDAAVKGAPDDAEPLIGRAMLRIETGDLEGALADCHAAVRIDPAAPFFELRADVRSQLGQIDAAVADYGVAIRMVQDGPRDDAARESLARMFGGRALLHEQRRDFEAAAADLEAALAEAPEQWPDRKQTVKHLADVRRDVRP